MKFLILVALVAVALADQTADSPAKASVATLVDLNPAEHHYGGYYGGYRRWGGHRGGYGHRWRRDADLVAEDGLSDELETAEHHRRRWGGYGGYGYGGFGYGGYGYGGWGHGRRFYG